MPNKNFNAFFSSGSLSLNRSRSQLHFFSPYVCVCELFLHFVSLCSTMWNVNARWAKSYKNWLIEGWRELKLSSAAAAAAFVDVVHLCAVWIYHGITLISICLFAHTKRMRVYVLECVSGKFWLLNGLNLTAFMNILLLENVPTHVSFNIESVSLSIKLCPMDDNTHSTVTLSLLLLLLTLSHWSVYIVCTFLLRLIYVAWYFKLSIAFFATTP